MINSVILAQQWRFTKNRNLTSDLMARFRKIMERAMDLHEAEMKRLVELTMHPGTCIADVARENGVKPQKLYAWRYKSKTAKCDNNTEISKSINFSDGEGIHRHSNNRRLAHEERIIVEFDGFRVVFSSAVSSHRIASIVAAIREGLIKKQ